MFKPQLPENEDNRHSAQEMDEIRQKNIAYEYMCHLEEAKKWLEAVLKEDLPETTELEENLRNGVYLAKLGHFMSPQLIPLEKIYDKEQKRYQVAGLQFRHTDNINYWRKALESAGLPVTFQPETTDVYDRKNMPRVIYCIHALSTHLFKLGRAPLIQDLYGIAEFTDAQIDEVSRELRARGIQMPVFQKIGGILSKNVGHDSAALHVAVIAINQAVDTGLHGDLMKALCNPTAGILHVAEKFIKEYQQALRDAKTVKARAIQNKSLNDSYVPDVYDELLTQAEIQGHIAAVNAICVWETALTGDPIALSKVLPLLQLTNIQQENVHFYVKEVAKIESSTAMRFSKFKKNGNQAPDATSKRRALQKAVTSGNETARKEEQLLAAVASVNTAMDSLHSAPMLATLHNPLLGLTEYASQFSIPLYHQEMRADRMESGKDMSLDELRQSLSVLSTISAVTQALDSGGPEATWKALCNPCAYISDLEPSLRLCYHSTLVALRKTKIRKQKPCTLLTHADIQICIDLVNEENRTNNGVIAWLKRLNSAVESSDLGLLMGCLADPVGNMSAFVRPANSQLYLKQLQRARLAKGCDLWLEDVSFALQQTVVQTPKWLVPLQAVIRGYLCRARLSHYLGSIVTIQTWWRGVLQRRRYRTTLRNIMSSHSWKDYEPLIVRLQALWRGHVVRRAFLGLVRAPNPSLGVVKHFAPLLRHCAVDHLKEMELQNLKGQVVSSIKRNQQLAQQVDAMDIKIGLLVQNRIALLDVATAGSNLAQLAKKPFGPGLKSFTKQAHDRLDAYQHLLYTLQTEPRYLSQLLLLSPQSNTSKILHNVIMTLFSFGASHRDQYLLLRLLSCALCEEIRTRFRAPSDAATANPLALKMAVYFARQQSVLKKIIGPLVEQVMNDRTLCMETNPVDIYKSWRNQVEMDTMKVSNLPHTVNQDQALGYAEVRAKFDTALKNLKDIALKFVHTIAASTQQIPYFLRYIASVLHGALSEQFPQVPDKDLLKIVGHLIYFMFINSAIVAPDAFDIVTLPPDRTLSNVQRRNLASIAKILQFAATKKGFGEESRHLQCLNPFIVTCHETMKTFFSSICIVEPLDEYFHINQYSDATLVTKPTVYITLQELCDTHQLLLTYEDQIAPDPLDPLHELLEDLGSKPSIATLLEKPTDDPTISTLAKTEVCLSLSNKFEVPENDTTDINKLFIKTKDILVWSLPCLSGDNLRTALQAATTPSQEEVYRQLLATKQGKAVVHLPNSLAKCKTELSQLLRRLELSGCVTSMDGYQSVLTAIARDICERGRCCDSRRREMQTLRSIKHRLEAKTTFYEEQINYYNQYTNKCLENLNTGKRNVHTLRSSGKHPGKLKSKLTLRYTAAKLHEKGILSEVQGLPQSQLKNVQFEITPTEGAGIFTIQGKFMGVVMETVDLDIQQLLQLQFEGVPITDIFGKAKVNVNLLLALLNRKFYGKV